MKYNIAFNTLPLKKCNISCKKIDMLENNEFHTTYNSDD
jgi:hypothetical protein